MQKLNIEQVGEQSLSDKGASQLGDTVLQKRKRGRPTNKEKAERERVSAVLKALVELKREPGRPAKITSASKPHIPISMAVTKAPVEDHHMREVDESVSEQSDSDSDGPEADDLHEEDQPRETVSQTPTNADPDQAQGPSPATFVPKLTLELNNQPPELRSLIMKFLEERKLVEDNLKILWEEEKAHELAVSSAKKQLDEAQKKVQEHLNAKQNVEIRIKSKVDQIAKLDRVVAALEPFT